MDLIEFLTNILGFLNNTILPFLMALAFLVFIFNIAKYFIFQGGQDEGREKAKRNALWGIIGFVLILSIWGIVNLLVGDLGFDREMPIESDYLEERELDGGTIFDGDINIPPDIPGTV